MQYNIRELIHLKKIKLNIKNINGVYMSMWPYYAYCQAVFVSLSSDSFYDVS